MKKIFAKVYLEKKQNNNNNRKWQKRCKNYPVCKDLIAIVFQWFMALKQQLLSNNSILTVLIARYSHYYIIYLLFFIILISIRSIYARVKAHIFSPQIPISSNLGNYNRYSFPPIKFRILARNSRKSRDKNNNNNNDNNNNNNHNNNAGVIIIVIVSIIIIIIIYSERQYILAIVIESYMYKMPLKAANVKKKRL